MLKRGERAALALAGGQRFAVPAAPVGQVVDPVGAGDGFDAGFLSAWLRGETLEAMLRLGARLGAAAVTVGEVDQLGPVNLLAWWERDDDGKVIVHAVLTNLPATAQTKAYGKRRMGIETVFRDWQSGGFHHDQSGVPETGRVVRLLVVLALAYLWLVSVGRWVVKRGYRRLIDDGSSHAWHFSLFQLGVGWKERLSSYSQPLPVRFFLYG